MPSNGKTVHYAQPIANNRSGGNLDSFDLYIEREATLDETLSEIVESRVRKFTLVIRKGCSDERLIPVSRGMAAALCGALEKALRETDEDEWVR